MLIQESCRTDCFQILASKWTAKKSKLAFIPDSVWVTLETRTEKRRKN